MKKLTASILGIVLVGTLITACSGDEKEAFNATPAYVAPVEKYNSFAKYACDDFRYLIQNADIMTFEEQTSRLRDIWVGASASTFEGREIPNFEQATRLLLSSAMGGHWDSAAEVGKIVVQICNDIPAP